jgi:hypothetical protein
MGNIEEPLFEVMTPLSFSVRTSLDYWQRILIKHPDLVDRLEDIKAALQNPTEIRCSQRDPNVFLFYSLVRVNRWVVAVARQLNGDGFLITAYRTDAIKEGERVWPK